MIGLREFQLVAGMVLTSLALSACDPGPSHATAAAPSPSDATTSAAKAAPRAPSAVSFDPDKGLYLPREVKRALGVTTEPVRGRTFQAHQEIRFEVFREAGEQPLPGMSYRPGFAYGSALLPGTTNDLSVGYKGNVVSASGAVEQSEATLLELNPISNSNQIEALVEIPDPGHQLKLDDFCVIRWGLATVSAPVAVPDASLLKTTQGDFVYLAKSDRFLRLAVTTGATGEGFTQITKGVCADDVIVIRPVQTLWLTELKQQSGGAP